MPQGDVGEDMFGCVRGSIKGLHNLLPTLEAHLHLSSSELRRAARGCSYFTSGELSDKYLRRVVQLVRDSDVFWS
jgi:inorganic triphosphatase YgiF